MPGFMEIMLREFKPPVRMAIPFGFVLWITRSETLAVLRWPEFG